MLSFFLVAEAFTGLIYHRPTGENSRFLQLMSKILANITIKAQTARECVQCFHMSKSEVTP